MKTLLKYVWRFCILTLSLIVLYFIIAIVLSYIPASSNEISEEKNKIIYIQSNGTHLDIIIPTSELIASLKQHLVTPLNSKYTCLGWGNKEFFFNVPEWKDLNFGLAFRALFFRLESAMHVISYENKKEDWIKVMVSETQLKQLNDFISNSFKRKDNSLLLCKRNSSGSNCFYDAEGRYSCINTCNVWVNDALKEANIPTSVWSPFHFGVLHHLEN